MKRFIADSKRAGLSASTSGRLVGRLLVPLALLTVVIGLVALRARQREKQGSTVAVAEQRVATAGRAGGAIRPKNPVFGENKATEPVIPFASSPTAAEPTEHARQLIDQLNSLKLVNGQIPSESIVDFRTKLLELQGLDLAAIPALEEFFHRGENVRYDSGSGTNLLGTPTLRLALMQMLLDVTLPDNEEFQARLIQTASDPEEVALLARQLEIAGPGHYRELIIDAAKASLEMVQNGKFPGRDTTPLLKLLEKLGVINAPVEEP